MTEFEKGQFDVLDWLSSIWHGKQYYFEDDNDLIYSRASHETMTLEEAIDEFANEIWE